MNPATNPSKRNKAKVTGRRITRLIEGGASQDGQTTYISMVLDHTGCTTLIIDYDQLRQLIYVLSRIAASTGQISINEPVEHTFDQPARIKQVGLETDGDGGLLMLMTTDDHATIVAQLPAKLAAKLAMGFPGALFRISEEQLGHAPSAALH